MAEPYKQVFDMGGKRLTAVVMDKHDFNDLCDSLSGVYNGARADRVDNTQIDELKKSDHIPLMQKGTMTECIFTKFDIATDYASFIVRGTARRMLS